MIAKRARNARHSELHTPSLWPVWATASVSVLVAGAVVLTIYLLLEQSVPRAGSTEPISKPELIRTALALAGFVGAVLAGVYAYRKQRLAEGDSRRADAEQLAARYAAATDQLGHSSAAVRLAGAYALARLADDWDEQRQVCIDVLCAYLRMPYERDAESMNYRQGEKSVRSSIVKIIGDHLQDPYSPTTWCGHDLDFTGAVFDDGSLAGSHFVAGEILFDRAIFCGEFRFDGSVFSGGHVSFCLARFVDGSVNFYRATFSGGWVRWDMARCTGGDLLLAATTFSGGKVTFVHADFKAGRLFMERADFCGSEVNFDGTHFRGTSVTFADATFRGGEVSLERAVIEDSHSDVSEGGVRVGEGQIIWGPFQPQQGIARSPAQAARIRAARAERRTMPDE